MQWQNNFKMKTLIEEYEKIGKLKNKKVRDMK